MRLERAAQPDGIRGSDGRQSLRQDLAVTAMAAEDVVLDIEKERATDRGGLLTDREMSRSAMVVGPAAIGRPDQQTGGERIAGANGVDNTTGDRRRRDARVTRIQLATVRAISDHHRDGPGRGTDERSRVKGLERGAIACTHLHDIA